jgi:hypothetical protein
MISPVVFPDMGMGQVCPTLALFYKIKSLLPASRRCKQGPSDS